MYRNQICHQSFNAWDAAADLHAEYHHVTNQSLHLFTFSVNMFVSLWKI